MSERTRDTAMRLGATGDETGVYVEVEPGFGTNVYVGLRISLYRGEYGRSRQEYVDTDSARLGLSLQGWERLCELVDEYREHQRVPDRSGQ